MILNPRNFPVTFAVIAIVLYLNSSTTFGIMGGQKGNPGADAIQKYKDSVKLSAYMIPPLLKPLPNALVAKLPFTKKNNGAIDERKPFVWIPTVSCLG